MRQADSHAETRIAYSVSGTPHSHRPHSLDAQHTADANVGTSRVLTLFSLSQWDRRFKTKLTKEEQEEYERKHFCTLELATS